MTTVQKKIYSKGSIISPEGSYEWEGNSDGNKGTITLTVDGNETRTINFTKDELEELFNQSVSRMGLDKRLVMDFMGDDENYVSPFKSNTKSRGNTKRRKNARKNKKSRRTKK